MLRAAQQDGSLSLRKGGEPGAELYQASQKMTQSPFFVLTSVISRL